MPRCGSSTPRDTELAESRDVFGADPFLDVTLPADGRYVIKVHDAVYAGSPDHVYRLIVHDGPHLDAILPLAAQPGSHGSLHADRPRPRPGRGGRCRELEGRRPPAWNAWPSRSLAPEARPIGIHPVPALDPHRPALVSIEALEYALVRPDPAGAAPSCRIPCASPRPSGRSSSRRSRITTSRSRRWSSPRATSRAPSASPGDVDLYRFQGKKGDVWIIEAIAERQGSPADPALLIQKVGAKGQPPQDLASADDLPDAGAGRTVQHAVGRRLGPLAGPRGRPLPGADQRSLRLAARRPAAHLPAADPPRAARLPAGPPSQQRQRDGCRDRPRRRADFGLRAGDPPRRLQPARSASRPPSCRRA